MLAARLAVAVLVASAAFSQTTPAKPDAAKPDAPKGPEEPGIPVRSDLVVAKCSGCHRKDDKGNLSRISWIRTTAEGWQQALKRMGRLNGLQLTPQEARDVVRYLANHHGLAPEEAREGLYFVEKRHLDEKLPNDDVRTACVSCHPYGQPLNWRRSKEEWNLLSAMHTGYFPVVEFTAFRNSPRFGNTPPPAPGTDTRHPVEKAIEHFSKTLPLNTPEWANWQASMRKPKLAGRWLVWASRPGKGSFTGEVVIEPGGDDESFTTRATLRSVRDGSTHTRAGRSTVYTGHSWRGRSDSKDGEAKQVREVMLVARDQASMEGRWFWGAYDEFGFDVKLVRADEGVTLLGTDRARVRSGESTSVTIYGDNLPSNLTEADVDAGAGVRATAISARSANSITVSFEVAKDAVNGKRDLFVRRASLTGALVVYDKIDYIKTTTNTALARLGGTTHPKGFWQFEAIGYNRGLDGKPNTNDDVALGPVDVEWSVEEFLQTYGDDDKDFVGTLSADGLLTPSVEGPNPKRRFSRNNYGDIWVVATYKGKDAAEQKDGKPLSARCYTVVTVPLYMRWDQPEVAQ